MIDLRFGELPQSLIVDGEDVPIKTDFRTWLGVQEIAKREKFLPFDIFPDGEPPEGDWVPAALEFMASKNECPHGSATFTQVDTLDPIIDGDYIAAAFQQAYGIDLTDPQLDMHWHRFLALLRGIPEDTKLAEIMGYRAWTESDSKMKYETRAKKLRDAWALPRRENKAAQSLQQAWFGGAVQSFTAEAEDKAPN